MTEPNRPQLGQPNAPCRSCGAPLAADQRYCLQCGTRRAEARLPFLEILARQSGTARAAEAAPATVRTGPSAWLGRMSTNAAAVAGVACLLLALGVGVLIGGLGDDGSSASAGTPQVISVGGGAVAPAAAPTTAVPAVTTTEDTGAGAASAKSTKKTKATTQGAATSKATNKALKSLDSTAGGDYAKKSAKLPKTLGTGGAPPPVDKSVPPAAAATSNRSDDEMSTTPDMHTELRRRRDELAEKVATLHWDLGGLTYEMAIRDHFRLDVLVRKAAELQDADAELGAVERLVAEVDHGVGGQCRACGALHSRGAAYCWRYGQALMLQAQSTLVGAAVVLPPAADPVAAGGPSPVSTPPPPARALSDQTTTPGNAASGTALRSHTSRSWDRSPS